MANVEEVTIAWLDSVAEGWPVYGDMPEDRSEYFILVDRTGGGREAMVLDRAEILIEVYHKSSRMSASNKANEIADAILSLVSYNDDITRAVVNSLVNLGDLVAGYQRYQIYCDVYLRR